MALQVKPFLLALPKNSNLRRSVIVYSVLDSAVLLLLHYLFGQIQTIQTGGQPYILPPMVRVLRPYLHIKPLFSMASKVNPHFGWFYLIIKVPKFNLGLIQHKNTLKIIFIGSILYSPKNVEGILRLYRSRITDSDISANRNGRDGRTNPGNKN